MDATTVINDICLPFDPTKIPVFGESTNWNKGRIGAEKDLVGFRRQSFAIQLDQAAAVGDPMTWSGTFSSLPTASTSLNMLSYGSGIGNLAGTAMTFGNYPTALGNFTYERSNMYPGGLMCQPEQEFVIIGLAIRSKPVFRVVSGVVTREPWMDQYQSAIQQLLLEHMTWQFQKNRETFAVFGENGPQYPSALSSGMQGLSSQNGEPLRGNVYPLCAALPVAAESGTSIGASPDAQLNVSVRAFTVDVDPFNQPSTQLDVAEGTGLVAEVEVTMFGYCRAYCQPNYCPPGQANARGQQVPG